MADPQPTHTVPMLIWGIRHLMISRMLIESTFANGAYIRHVGQGLNLRNKLSCEKQAGCRTVVVVRES